MADESTSDVPYPGYIARRPQYPAFRQLRYVAGMQDTLVNLAELALRYFERDMAKQSNMRAFVDTVADDLDVNTSLGAPWEQVRLNAQRYSVAQGYAVFDAFCRRLATEFRRYHELERWAAQDCGRQLDALAALTANMAPEARKRARACPEYDLLHYYREVRNRVLHASDTDTDELRDRVVERHAAHLVKAYGGVPQAFDSISYDDYLLLTRAMKYYAAVLNDGCALDVSLIMNYLLRDQGFVAEARRRKGNAEKLRRLSVIVRERYALSADHSHVIRSRIDLFLADDPPHKLRRRQARSR